MLARGFLLKGSLERDIVNQEQRVYRMNKTHYEDVCQAIEGKASLLVVSKYHSIDEAMAYYEQGIRHFGENRMQELLPKASQMPSDIQWHFLGHLQKDKVKKVVPVVSMIQSLDSIELADKIEQVCSRLDKMMPCLIEVHLADDGGAKTGIDKKDLFDLASHCFSCPHIDLQGIMVMGPHVEDEEEIKNVFREGFALFSKLQSIYGSDIIRVYSAGMSDDFKIALEEGSTQVRIGSYLF